MSGRNGPVKVARSIDDVRALAAVLGHGDVDVHRNSRGMWVYDCACGFSSKPLALLPEQVRLARDHLAASVRELERYARDHGLSRDQALSELAVDQDEFQAVVGMRIEERRHRNW